MQGQITWALNIILCKHGHEGHCQFIKQYAEMERTWALQRDLNLNHSVATFILCDLERVSYFL